MILYKQTRLEREVYNKGDYANMREFLNKPMVKNTIMAAMVLIIGGLCSALGGWDYKGDKYFWIKFLFLTIFGILYIILLLYYSFSEDSLIKENEALNKVNIALEKQRDVYEDVMTGEVSICKQSAGEVTQALHDIASKGTVNLNIWSFDKASNLACVEIYRLLCKLHGTSKDFGVSYIRLDEEKEMIYMSGFANQNMQIPTVFGKRRAINDSNAYHDADLFKKGKADIEALKSKDESNKVFVFKKASNPDKYTQYIAVPVFCADRKMVGLLEVTCLNGTTLAETEKELKDLASKYLVAYAFFLLLLHKLEKALLAMPKTHDMSERK